MGSDKIRYVLSYRSLVRLPMRYLERTFRFLGWVSHNESWKRKMVRVTSDLVARAWDVSASSVLMNVMSSRCVGVTGRAEWLLIVVIGGLGRHINWTGTNSCPKVSRDDGPDGLRLMLMMFVGCLVEVVRCNAQMSRSAFKLVESLQHIAISSICFMIALAVHFGPLAYLICTEHPPPHFPLQDVPCAWAGPAEIILPRRFGVSVSRQGSRHDTIVTSVSSLIYCQSQDEP